jgi:hypothetical protein
MRIGGPAIPAPGAGNIEAEDVKGGEAGVSKSFRYVPSSSILIIYLVDLRVFRSIILWLQSRIRFLQILKLLCSSYFVSLLITAGKGEGNKHCRNIKRKAVRIAKQLFWIS